MPQAYTHFRVARAAAVLAAAQPEHRQAYFWGAQGPDVFFFATPWKALKNVRSGGINIASQMHHQHVAAFVSHLLHHAKTPVQQSYVQGFLTHYETDEMLHPYVLSQMQAEPLFGGKSGHAKCEASLDTYFCAMDTGRVRVQIATLWPALSAAEFVQITALLRQAAVAVYGREITLAQVADACHYYKMYLQFCCGANGVKQAAARVCDTLTPWSGGAVHAHQSPAPVPKNGFAQTWQHPTLAETQTAGPIQLCLQAAQRSAVALNASFAYWNGLQNADSALAMLHLPTED